MEIERGLSVVITGASSGIGRAAAHIFAERGARLTLLARRSDLLDEVVEECERLGGQAVSVVADVTDPEDVVNAARVALDAYGGIDVWINNAGTGVFGPFAEGGIALHKQVIEVNLLGSMYGAAAALPVFRRQGHGILINNISMGGWAPVPFAAAYTASKFGLRGFTASLRRELRNWPDIHVCAVFPASIDTPGFEHGANQSDREIDPGSILYAPEDVAEAFVGLVEWPRDEVAVGWPARAGQIAYALAPGPVEHLMGAALHRYMRRAPPAPRTQGAHLHPLPNGRGASGGWRERKGVPSARAPSIGLAVAGAALAIGTVALTRRRRGSKR
jgi:short-subunit dehydrogenase